MDIPKIMKNVACDNKFRAVNNTEHVFIIIGVMPIVISSNFLYTKHINHSFP